MLLYLINKNKAKHIQMDSIFSKQNRSHWKTLLSYPVRPNVHSHNQGDQMSWWKITQTVVIWSFRQNERITLTLVKKEPKYVGYFCNFQKVPKVNCHPMGENSPNHNNHNIHSFKAVICCILWTSFYFKWSECTIRQGVSVFFNHDVCAWSCFTATFRHDRFFTSFQSWNVNM
jgi:hypothetical protein